MCGLFVWLPVFLFNNPAAQSTEYFVNKHHPSASDSNDGLSLARPFKTIDRGLDQLWPGDILTIRQGAYREAVEPRRSGTAAEPITIRAYPGDEGGVYIRGSEVVTGWTYEGANIWSVDWEPLPLLEYPPAFIDYGLLSKRREMIFVNGSRLKQVLSRSALTSGCFWVDDSAQKYKVYFVGNLNDAYVQISVRERGIWAFDESHMVWIGLTVEHVTNDSQNAAMRLGPFHKVVNCRVLNNNQVGISVDSDGTILDSVANHNGRVGITINGSNTYLESSETSYNSWRYGPRWSAGGIKVFGTRPTGIRIFYHTAIANNGRGIWFDTAGSGNKVEGSFLEGNVLAGIQFEATRGPNWAINNVVIGTTITSDAAYPESEGIGIFMRDARDTYVYNNTIVDVEGGGIVIGGNERDDGQDYVGNTWVFNNIIVNSGTAEIRFWLWGDALLPSRIDDHRFDNNLYYGPLPTIIFPNLASYGTLDWSLADWQANRGQDLNSLYAPPHLVSADKTLLPDSPAINAGRDLVSVTVDRFGTSRPQGVRSDIGSHEYTGDGGFDEDIFCDGFSEANAEAWSLIVGG